MFFVSHLPIRQEGGRNERKIPLSSFFKMFWGKKGGPRSHDLDTGWGSGWAERAVSPVRKGGLGKSEMQI